jgi:hypothetical protein
VKWFLIALALLAVALLAVAALVWLLRRPSKRRPSGAPARPGRPSRPIARPKPTTTRSSTTKSGTATITTGPTPGEIWWADVPYDDGSGSKVRPCVVLRPYRGGFEVLKITSQDQSRRGDHVEIPTRGWDADADHNSFLDLSDPIRVATAAFDDKAGSLDAGVWTKVKALHKL